MDNPNDIKGVNNDIQRRVYDSKPIFTDLTNSDGRIEPPPLSIIQLSDDDLDIDATITSEDVALAFAELDEPLLINLFNADVQT